MKLELLVLFAAVTLPALSSALLFGVTLTNTAGATILALNPTAVAAVAALKVGAVGLAAAAAGLLAARNRPRPTAAPAPRPVKTKYRHHYRGRRESAGAKPVAITTDELYDRIFSDLAETKMVGCFQRLVCDIAARPAGFIDNVPILEGLAVVDQLELSPAGKAVSFQLLKAMKFGADIENVNQCEGLFNECKWTGRQMDSVIQDMRNRV